VEEMKKMEKEIKVQKSYYGNIIPSFMTDLVQQEHLEYGTATFVISNGNGLKRIPDE
jgi:hypothetical protein